MMHMTLITTEPLLSLAVGAVGHGHLCSYRIYRIRS
jgi:hypothetical protein